MTSAAIEKEDGPCCCLSKLSMCTNHQRWSSYSYVSIQHHLLTSIGCAATCSSCCSSPCTSSTTSLSCAADPYRPPRPALLIRLLIYILLLHHLFLLLLPLHLIFHILLTMHCCSISPLSYAAALYWSSRPALLLHITVLCCCSALASCTAAPPLSSRPDLMLHLAIIRC